MPITLKTNAIKVKNSQGTYQSVDCIQGDSVPDVKTGTARPTTSTVAEYVGQLYLNTNSTDNYGFDYGFYICTAISEGTYTWRKLFVSNDSIGAVNLSGVQSNGEPNVITIGKGAGNSYTTYAISIGFFAQAGRYGVAIGSGFAKTTAAGVSTCDTIQLGQGTNSESGSFQVNKYKMLDVNGQIPPERITPVVSVSGTTPSITALPGVRYVCGEVATLSITPPASGCIDVVFESGSTPTVLTVNGTVKWANGFDPSSLDADTTYEINILDGLGVAGAWT